MSEKVEPNLNSGLNRSGMLIGKLMSNLQDKGVDSRLSGRILRESFSLLGMLGLGVTDIKEIGRLPLLTDMLINLNRYGQEDDAYITAEAPKDFNIELQLAIVSGSASAEQLEEYNKLQEESRESSKKIIEELDAQGKQLLARIGNAKLKTRTILDDVTKGKVRETVGRVIYIWDCPMCNKNVAEDFLSKVLELLLYFKDRDMEQVSSIMQYIEFKMFLEEVGVEFPSKEVPIILPPSLMNGTKCERTFNLNE